MSKMAKKVPEFDPNKIGFTLRIDDATIRKIEQMQAAYDRALIQPRPFLFK